MEIKETATLKDVDQFLRDIWVECCGHLSAFDIGGISYDVAPQDDFSWGKLAKSMNCKLKSVLEKGMTFGYEYDFGSTTELMITVVNYRVGDDRKEKLIILSRNNPIEVLCEVCGKARNAFMREADGCVKTVPRLTSVERKCFYRFVIRHGWVFAVIVEATFIRNSFFQIQIKQYDLQ
ncbi:MAG: plasmid pRiA4b ORF-3 family protein [Lachnospiraceae bacterium]|nr:plasmid pRiA4b ORF-3 family protein [Lachnospiraceae bacterium]